MTPNELRQLRQRLALSQAALGDAVGLTGRYIRKLEAGNAPISLTVEMAVLYLADTKELKCEPLK